MFQMIGGIGNGLTTTSALAIISSYKEDRQAYIGYFEIISGLGTLLGPTIGAGFYELGGYEAPFFGIGGIYTCVVIFGICMKPKTNEADVEHEEVINEIQERLDRMDGSFVESGEPKKIISFCEVLGVMRSLFGFIIQFLVYFILAFNTPILNTHLDKLNYTPKFISASISMVALTYALTIPLVQVMTKSMNKRGILFIGIVLTIVGTLFTGLESKLDFHHTSAFVLVGTAIFGIGFAMVTIPVMPEILEAVEDRKDMSTNMDEQALYNNLSGYFVVCQATGESLGPALSSLLELRFDF
jgi:MFS family permease